MKCVPISALPKLIDEVLTCMNSGKYDGKTIIWFGYTPHLSTLQKALMMNGRRIDFAIDNDKKKWGLNSLGLIECRPPGVLTEHIENRVVFISSVSKKSMMNQLINYGYEEEQIVCFKSPQEHLAELRCKEFGELDGLRRIGLEESKALMLELMKHYRDFCENHGLRYYLAEGTLLGAVRHKGFIPWDNDVDIFMPDTDYQTFQRIYPVGGQYELLSWRSVEGFATVLNRLAVSDTLLLMSSPIDYLPIGVCIDVAPLGGFHADKQSREKRFREIYEQNWKWMSMRYYLDYCDNKTEVFEEMERIKFLDAYDSSDYVGMLHFVSKRIPPWAVPRTYFSETVDLEFEGEFFKAPAGYDEYLTERYGDYMTLPPEKERFVHDFSSYWLDGKPLKLLGE